MATNGSNVEMSLDGNILTIKVDLTRDLGPSKSGKTRIIASTGGAERLKPPHGDVRVGLNVYR